METPNSCFSYLAEDLLFKILLLLPISSLFSLKFVCKFLFSIISSHKFVEAHLINSKKNLPCSLLKVFTYHQDDKHEYHGMEDVNYSSTCYDIYVTSHDDKSVRIELPRRLSGSNRFFGSCNGLVSNRFFGSCNGLVCLVKPCMILEDLYLWNPFTKQFKYLPTPRNKSASANNYHIGLGFDSVSDDYKILRIVFDNFFGKSNGLVAEVYSANADSWKEIEVPKPLISFSMFPDSRCVYVQPGALYFEGTNQILSFNLHDEVFEAYPYPNPEQHTRKSNLLEFEGSAAVILESLHDPSVLSIWTLNNGNVSWTKQINLDLDFKIDRVVLYLGAGQFVVAVPKSDDNSGYILYDFKKREVKNISLRISGNKVTSLFKYTESLVSLEGFEQENEYCLLSKKR